MAAKFDDPEFAEIVGASCRLSLAKARDYAQRENDLAIVGKTYSTQVNTTGGYLVNESVAEAIVYMTEAFGTSRELANEVRMPEATHRARRKTAIGAMYAMSEGGTYTDVQPTYDMVNLVARTRARSSNTPATSGRTPRSTLPTKSRPARLRRMAAASTLTTSRATAPRPTTATLV